MQQVGTTISSHGLDQHGITKWRMARWNLRTAALYEQAVQRREGMLTKGGALVCTTGEHTGRSPRDKYIVKEASCQDKIAWGSVNQPMSEEQFDSLLGKVQAHYQAQDLFVQDLHAGADADYRLKVRVVTEHAWHSMFARNMFITPPTEGLADFVPDFTVLHAPDFRAEPEQDGTRSSTFIAIHFARKLVLIGGSSYAGEIKKSIFTVLNYLLPQQGVMPMHCSANMGDDGDVALFFGLSGTGKTTLSSDSSRTLIGDDEHGWSGNGIFNFEGGCYAKVVRLDKEAEPEIHDASLRFGSILENVVTDPETRLCDFDDESLTENTRSSYPLNFIPNASNTGIGGHPKNIVMLTADAFGVLPPISKLTPEQAMYHFLSGYTARVAGTEKGVTEPEATFSSCFGAPFMPCPPTVYAELLGKLVRQHQSTCWLVNTGWTGGAAGTGSRMKIAHTRAMLRAALSGKLDSVDGTSDPVFGLWVPAQCPDVPSDVLMPRNSWADKAAYDTAAAAVAKRFEENFKPFEGAVDANIVSAGIHAAA